MTNKEASSYLKIRFIVCCFLLTAPNNKKLSVSHTLSMVSSQCVSQYCDLFIMETKKNSFFPLLGTLPQLPLSFFAWLMI